MHKYASNTAATGSIDSKMKGKDFFDFSCFSQAATRPLFFQFIAELKEACSAAVPTPAHQFLKKLADEGRLSRWYTQNIDCLEERIGLPCFTAPAPQSTTLKPVSQVKSCTVVSLHGTLSQVVCTQCRAVYPFSESHLDQFKRGDEPACPSCIAAGNAREALGRRRLRKGFLRPDIVLYNEPHPHGDIITEFVQCDISRQPSLLLVMGTSLKIAGLKRMIKDMVKSMKSRVGGAENTLVIYVNKTPAPKAEWRSFFDFELIGECDQWLHVLEQAVYRPVSKKKLDVLDEVLITNITVNNDPKATIAGPMPARKGLEALLPSSPLGHIKRGNKRPVVLGLPSGQFVNPSSSGLEELELGRKLTVAANIPQPEMNSPVIEKRNGRLSKVHINDYFHSVKPSSAHSINQIIGIAGKVAPKASKQNAARRGLDLEV